MQFLGKIGQKGCWQPLWGWRSLLWEILDPPLFNSLTILFTYDCIMYPMGFPTGASTQTS